MSRYECDILSVCQNVSMTLTLTLTLTLALKLTLTLTLTLKLTLKLILILTLTLTLTLTITLTLTLKLTLTLTLALTLVLVPNASSPGPDGIPLCCFTFGDSLMLEAVEDILKSSVDQGLFPHPLKDTGILPNHKGDSRLVPSNYRPLDLTGNLTKIMKRVVRAQVVSYLKAKTMMDETQNRAKSGRSTLTQLLIQHQSILEILGDQENVELKFLDFSKAFDIIDHSILISK